MQIHADADPQHWAWVLAESDCELPESQEPDSAESVTSLNQISRGLGPSKNGSFEVSSPWESDFTRSGTSLSRIPWSERF
jgi:hypothetical protein